VTRVTVSPDRHAASVFVSVLPERLQNRTLAGLRHAAGHIQSLLRKVVAMRIVPRLDFQLDDGLKKQSAVFKDIAKAVAVEQNHAKAAPDDP
jgi:ribosome-binding factor A